MHSDSSRCRIVAFCSPKGGVGRSTAVANVAWVLATTGRRVLVVDCDLEDPSLHAFFRPFLLDPDLLSTEGVIDAVSDYAVQAQSTHRDPDLLRYVVSLEWDFPEGGALDLLPAGRQSPAYPVRVAEFNWRAFLDGPHAETLLSGVERTMRAEYDAVLLDLHCGLTEAGRMCAGRLADAVVLCFTLAPSSVEAARALAELVQSERAHVPADYFPVPMRVDPFEKELLERGRRHAREAFAPFLALTGAPCETYWADVEVAYIPFYAYSEVLAPFGDRPGDTNSVLAAAERLASYLVGQPIGAQVYASPETSQQVLAQYNAGTGTEASAATV
ncbi:MAG TPA: AAA family ATPase [Longimicrobium sp.]|nr:AAA family ATPase [Longimicrobium sp.]